MDNLNKYHRGKVYAIRSHQTKNIYIGSSIGRLSERLSKHKCDLKRYITGKGSNYIRSYEVVKFQDCYIELIEEVKANNKMELTRREGQIIRETLNCINKYIAGRTQAEYQQDNREVIAIQKNQKFNCPCGGKYTHSNKFQHSRTQKHQAYITTS